MEDLMVVINVLEDERERLLTEKEKNLLIIQGYEKRISYFRYIISSYNWGRKLKENQIESYSSMLDFSTSNHSLFFSPNSLGDYIEGIVLKLTQEIEEIECSQNKIGLALVTTMREKHDLEEVNEQIDFRLVQIDEELENSSNRGKCEKVYTLGGNKNDRY